MCWLHAGIFSASDTLTTAILSAIQDFPAWGTGYGKGYVPI